MDEIITRKREWSSCFVECGGLPPPFTTKNRSAIDRIAKNNQRTGRPKSSRSLQFGEAARIRVHWSPVNGGGKSPQSTKSRLAV